MGKICIHDETNHSTGAACVISLNLWHVTCVSYNEGCINLTTIQQYKGTSLTSFLRYFGFYLYILMSRWREGARFSVPVQTGPEAHPASYTMGTGSFPGLKRSRRGVDHTPPSSAEVKERVEVNLYSSSGPVLGRPLPLSSSLLSRVYCS